MNTNELSPEKQALLAMLLASKGVDCTAPTKIPVRTDSPRRAVSFAQERMWFLEQLHPGTATYNMPMTYRLDGRLDLAALRSSLNAIICRHAVLRTCFEQVDEVLQQLVATDGEIALHEVDLRLLTPEQRQEALQRHIALEESTPFDLTCGPLMRVTLLAWGEHSHYLLLTMHHIISDGMSVNNLLAELTALYSSYVAGSIAALPTLALQYGDFAEWERARLKGETLSGSLRYWRRQLEGATALALPSVTRTALRDRSGRGESVSLVLPTEMLDDIKALCAAQRATLFMLCFATCNAVLQRASGQDDLVIGTPIGNRNSEDLTPLIGLFVNTVAMRTRIVGDPSFDVLLAQVKETTLGAFMHQHLPFDRVIAELGAGRPSASAPLISTMFVLDDATTIALALPGIEVKPLRSASGVAKFDLVMELVERDGVLIASMQFSTDLFDRPFINTLLEDFALLLKAAVACPFKALSVLWREVARERAHLGEQAQERQLAYRDEQRAALANQHALPLDRPRRTQTPFAGTRVEVSVGYAPFAALMHLAGAQQASLFMLLHAAFSLLIGRHADRHVTLIGTRSPGSAATVALRTDCTTNVAFTDYLADVKAVHLDALRSGALPFEDLVQCLQDDTGKVPHCQLILSMESQAQDCAQADLLLEVQPRADGLTLQLHYNGALFDQLRMARMAGHLVNLLEAIAVDPLRPIHQLPMLGRAELEHLVHEVNDTEAQFPDTACIHSLFEAQVMRCPDAVALGDGRQALSYAQLNRRANRLAHHLIDLGVGPDDRVAVCMERSVAMVVTLLAILKAGGAYVPIDPVHPVQRLTELLADCNPVVVLTDQVGGAALPALSVPVLLTEDDQESDWPAHDPDPDVRGVGARNLAYIMYTSGSSGSAKGVMIEHRNVLRLVINNHYAPLGQGDCVAHCANPAFDASTWEIWSALLNGARLWVIDPASMLAPARFSASLKEGAVSALWLTVGLFNEYVNVIGDAFGQLRYLLIGGDALDPKTVRRILSGGHAPARLINGYGPTETTTFATTYAIDALDEQSLSVPIGQPIANTRVYLLDVHGQPVPQGAMGELFIGGPGVARGYLNAPQLSAQRFVSDPFNPAPNARMFKTGDLGRRRSDGQIEFLGRNDGQVKIRGFRVELGEIEVRLAGCAGVRNAVIIVREDTPGVKQLVAYLTAHQGAAPTAPALRAALSAQLADFMLPAAFVLLDAFPLTPNGKLDRQALPAPDYAATTGREFAVPAGEIEVAMAEIWQELLGIARIGRDDSFLDVGGHSLQAMRLATRVAERFGVELTVRDVFARPTLRALAQLCEGAAVAERAPIPVCARGPGLQLSSAQQGVWFHAQLSPVAGAAYHISIAQELRGQLDVAALQGALNALVARHEALRSCFVTMSGQVEQRVRNADTVCALRHHDLSVLSPEIGRQRLAALSTDEAAQPFDLAQGPLIRGRLLRLGGDEAVLLITVHHLVADGWSVRILLDELSALYRGCIEGRSANLPTLPVQFVDYAAWQRERMKSSALRAQLDFWKAHLGGVPGLLDLPSDRPRPALPSYRGGRVGVALTPVLTNGLRDLSQRHGVTMFMTLLTAWAVLLSRLSGQHDVVIGTPVANRQRSELEGLIGFFVNTVAIRVRLDDNPSVAAMLAQVRVNTMDAFSNSELPFEQLVEALQPQRSNSHHPLFQAMLTMDTTPGANVLVLPGVAARALETAGDAAQFDVSLALTDRDGIVGGTLGFATDLFERVNIERMVEQFELILSGMVRDDQQGIGELPLLSDAQQQLVLHTFNATAAPFPREASIDGLFELQAARSPGAAAVEDCGGVLTYAQLNERANRLAHHLIGCGVGPASLVGVCMERSAQSVVALLAILKAGGAYVALDPRYPDQRLADMVDDSGVGWLLTQTSLRERLAAHAVLGRAQMALLAVDEPALVGELAQRSAANPARVADPTGLAYLIYTSGSTGRPKAVAICHRNTVAMISWAAGAFSARELRRVLFSTSLNFDLSVFELFVPLSLGGTVVVVADAMALLDKAGGAALDLSLINTVPSACRVLVDSGAIPASVCVVNLAGEALPPALVNALLDCPTVERVCNLYGPSEDTTYSSHISYTDKLEGAVSIGRPIDNTQFYLLDRYGKPVPLGVAGEIYIGGAGVALGYLNRPELSAQRFLVDPFAAPGGRMYRTGDLARWLADGTLEYLGRNDFQVKLRGFRIELGEIEACLCRCEGVREAVVIAREDTPGQPRLVAYLSTVPGQAEAVLLARVRAALQQALPDYMMPSAFVVLAALPLNANGKVDRKALPAPAGTVQERVFVAPETPLEQLVASVWSDLLQVPQVGMDDDFFVCGGHSILAVRIVLQLAAIVSVIVPLRDLFAAPTVRGLVATVERLGGGHEAVNDIVAIYGIVRNLSEIEVAELAAEYT